MFSFFPKDEKFLTLLNKLADSSHAAAHQLNALMRCPTPHDEVAAISAIIKAKADAKTTSLSITKELCRSFVTPFDREDIQLLADHLYKIPKIAEKIMERIRMHKLTRGQEDFYPQVELIQQEADVMREMIRELGSKKSSKKVLEYVSTLNQLEQKGDNIRESLLEALYASDRDIRDLLIRRDIYDMLEKVVDKFRDLSGVALQIVLKNS